MLATVVGALAFCSPLWSDARIRTGASSAQKMCYCDCDMQAGAPVCTHMCDLPKYENRPWANSCHKKQDSELSQPSSAPNPHSSKNNRVQQARR